MQKTIFLAALLLSSVSLWGQSTFHKNFQNGRIFFAKPLSSGGMLGSGYQDQPSPVPNQGLLVRFNDDGAVVWRKKYPSLNKIAYFVETNNGFVILGDSARSNGPLPRPRYSIVSKLSNSGDVIWSKILGNTLGQATPTQVISVGNGYVISGSYEPFDMQGQVRPFISSLDENGNTLWSKIYLTNNPNYFGTLSTQLIEGDTLYVCGHIQGNGSFLRINRNTGEIIGLSSVGGIYLEKFSTLKPTQDGNFILAGYTRSTTDGEELRPWVIKVNRSGQIIWSKVYNIPGTSFHCNLTAIDDGGFALAIGREDGLVNGYALLVKIDSAGNLLWAYNYSAGQVLSFREIQSTQDGGVVACGEFHMVKPNNLGEVINGCCPAPVLFQVENYAPPLQNPVLIPQDWELTTPFPMKAVADTLFKTSDFCETEITSLTKQILLCQGDSIQINGTYFHAPYTVRDTVQNLEGGCDTVKVYNLVQIPQPFRVETISFCPGSSVVVNGVTYTQLDTISQILPATAGCDTLLVTFLKWKTFPKKYQTTTFCPGDTVFFNGIGYQFPSILPNPDTLPTSAIGCDTLLYHVLAYPVEPSTVSVQCPPNVVLSTAPATPIVVHYSAPIAASDCTCPELNISLIQGFPSGAVFPVGNTQVCYAVGDVCGDYEACCFEVKVNEENACDVKESGCIQYEFLGISADAEQNKTYRVRVTNHCVSPLSYTAFQIPNGVEAIAPAQNSPYISPNGSNYTVRNPNHTPFRSVRFKPLGNGISAGQSDVFEYTLPAQASPIFIKATTRLASGAFYEVMLNTFGCVLLANRIADRTTSLPVSLPSVRVFPNPSSGELFVDLSEWESGLAHLRVLNIHGQEVAQIQITAGEGIQTFQMPKALPDGLYFLEMKSEKGERQAVKFALRR